MFSIKIEGLQDIKTVCVEIKIDVILIIGIKR